MTSYHIDCVTFTPNQKIQNLQYVSEFFVIDVPNHFIYLHFQI